MRLFAKGLFFFFSIAALADGTEEGLNAFCDDQFNEVRDCCLKGKCSVVGSGPIAVDPESMRGYRRLCFNWRGESTPQCPNGKHLHAEILKYVPGPEHLTVPAYCRNRSGNFEVNLSAVPDNSSRLSSDESLRALISANKVLCESHIDKMLNQVESSFSSCGASRKKALQDLKADVTGSFKNFLENPSSRRQLNDGQPESEYLRVLKAETCPAVQEWNGHFRKARNLEDPQFMQAVDYATQNVWGRPATDGHLKPLLTNECFESVTTRILISSEADCRGTGTYSYQSKSTPLSIVDINRLMQKSLDATK